MGNGMAVGPDREAAQDQCFPWGTPLLCAWISLPKETQIPLHVVSSCLILPLFFCISNPFSLLWSSCHTETQASPDPPWFPTPSSSWPPPQAVQPLVSPLPLLVHHVHRFLLPPFLHRLLSRVPGDLWFPNVIDCLCGHSFHRYVLKPYCVLSTITAIRKKKIKNDHCPCVAPMSVPGWLDPPQSLPG